MLRMRIIALCAHIIYLANHDDTPTLTWPRNATISPWARYENPPIGDRHYIYSILLPLTCQLRHIGHFYFLYVFLCVANRLYVRLSLLSHEFEQLGSLHVCTKEINRPQRDSNPVPPGSESTTLPMRYPDASDVRRARSAGTCAKLTSIHWSQT